jgi:hypothetical protein
MSSSTNTDIDVNINNQKLIEKTIENKFNQVLDKIPSLNEPVKYNKLYSELNFYDIYKNTMNVVIDIINDIISLIDEQKYISYNEFYIKLYNVFFVEERFFYIGIIFILLSMIIYFIDGATI